MTDYDTITRLGAGTLSAQTILADSSYLVSNFTLFDDRQKTVGWVAFVDNALSEGQLVQSLGGIGGLVGKLSGTLTFASISPKMLQYIYENVLQSRHINLYNRLVA